MDSPRLALELCDEIDRLRAALDLAGVINKQAAEKIATARADALEEAINEMRLPVSTTSLSLTKELNALRERYIERILALAKTPGDKT